MNRFSIALCFVVAASQAQAQTYDLPFKADDLRDDERVYWGRDYHAKSGAQAWGFDFEIVRYDPKKKKWLKYKSIEGKDDSDWTGRPNKDWYVHGKNVYAMRDGVVIACWRNAPENYLSGRGKGNYHDEMTKYEDGDGACDAEPSRIYGGGNGMWVQHADGSRAEYAHFMPGTVPAALCPNDDALLPKIPSQTVADAWTHLRLPARRTPIAVRRGQFLGKAGNVGCSSNPHTHVHVETGGSTGATYASGSPVQMSFERGLYVKENTLGPFQEWKSFAGKPIPEGPLYIWPPRSLGVEYARHGFDAANFGAFVQHLADSGYGPTWIDAYNVGGKNFLNHVWRPASGWRAFFLVNATTYQQEFDKASADGLEPIFVESSVSGGQARYTMIFVKNAPGDAYARHGLTYDQHMDEMAKATGMGMVPVNVSVISIGGERRYTVLHRTGKPGTRAVKSQIAEEAYQPEYDDQTAAGRKPVYLNAYVHGGKPFISAIFGPVSTPARKDSHGMSAASYQTEYASALKAGMLTRAVTSFDGAQTQHRYAACWWK